MIKFALLIIFLHIVQIFYFEQSSFFDRYDVSYWKDRFEHAQWRLHESRRIIGDDGIYAYIGYTLVKGGNPAGINAETLPLGKYLIGLSILIFNSPAWYGFIMGISSLFLFYLLCKILFRNSSIPILLTTFLFLDPLFFTQFWNAWLDITELFFLLLNLVLILKISNTKQGKNWLLVVLSGFALGLFTQTKPPILLPTILLLELLYLFLKKMRWEIIVFLFAMFFAAALVYTRYYFLGHTPIDFLRVQKYILAYYLQPQPPVHIGGIWQVLLFGKFPEILSGSLIVVKEWWIIWSLVAVVSITMCCVLLLRKSTLIWKGLAIFLLMNLITLSIIPAYPRYLIPILPFFYLFLAKAMEKFLAKQLISIIFVLLFFYGVIHASIFLVPSEDAILKNFSYNLSHMYFQDVYQENLAKENLPAFGRDTFRITTQNAMQQATVREVKIHEKKRHVTRLAERGNVKLLITYKTQDLGEFSEEKDIELVKERNRWKIKWDWNILLSGFSPAYTLETHTALGRRGSIIDGRGRYLAQDMSGYIILVTPQKIDTKREKEMLELIGRLGYREILKSQNAYLENVYESMDVPLTTIYRFSTEPNIERDIKKLLSYPGVHLVNYPSRIYHREIDPTSIENTEFEECCTRIYSSYNYHGVKGFEKEYDTILHGYSGGTIVMKNKNGEVVRTILEKKAKDGQDVKIPYCVVEC